MPFYVLDRQVGVDDMDVFEAIAARSSKRAFLNKPLPKEILVDVIAAAGRAPSAINLQPWECTVVQGDERPRLSRALLKAFRERNIGCGAGSSAPIPDNIKQRQLSSFIGLDELLETDGRGASDFINRGSLDFYGAPAALIITKDNYFSDKYLTSTGIFIGYLLLAAQAAGLGACPVGLINSYQDVILDFLNLDNRDLVLGLALGYPDPDAPVNRFRTPREPVAELIRWYG